VKYFCATLLLVSSMIAKPVTLNATQLVSLSSTDPDFSIVLFPDTQYYNGQNSYVFSDQANWVVANQSALNIKMVLGLGDIVDGGGYPVDSNGNVIGSCANAPPPNWRIWAGVKPAFCKPSVREYWSTAVRVVITGLPPASVTMLLLASSTGADPPSKKNVPPKPLGDKVRSLSRRARRP